MQPISVLSPVLQDTANRLLRHFSKGGVLLLRGAAGTGKTTVLKNLHAARGGALIHVREILAAPGGVQEAFLRSIEEAMQAHDLVMVDDLHLVIGPAGKNTYARTYLLDAALTALLGEARVMNQTFVFATRKKAPWSIERRAYVRVIGDPGSDGSSGKPT